MEPSPEAGSDAGVPHGLWASAVGAGGGPDAKALLDLAGTFWYCAYAWWRRAGLDPVSTATATLACFERWLGDAPPGAGDSGAARMRGWMLARLPELAGQGVKLIGEGPLEINRQWAEKRYAEEPEGDPDAIFQRRWALTVIEAAASRLRDEYSARGEEKMYAELMGFAGFNQEDGDRYSKVAQRLGQTSGAIRKAVFEFRNRQREILHRLVADTVLDPDDAESEITALLCACDATGPETSTAPLPSLLQGQRPDEILVRAMRSVKMTHNGSGAWQPPTIAEAALLFPQYEIVSIIGRGGMGAVYRGRQVELDRPVAIKLLPLEVSVDPAFADRFRREARAMAKLNHPNIILIHEFGSTSEGHLYFVMEFVEGADLHQMIHGPGVTPEQSLSIISGVCDALAYAHGKGVVHRDIKPANVMVGVNGEVKVADFGLARLLDPGADQIGHTMTGTVMGTPDYMAPEQMRGMNVDHRADIYSLGVMLYEMLCKEVPRGIFDPPSLRVPGLGTGIDQVVIKAMQQQPERRYQSTTEMKVDVAVAAVPEQAAHRGPKLVTPPQPLVRSPQPAPKPEAKPAPKPARVAKASSKKPVAIAAACLVPLLGFGGWYATRDRSGSVPPEAAKSDPASPGEASATPAKAQVPVPAAKTPAWIQPQLPRPGAEGWITIFDGKVLRGVIVPASNLAGGSVRLENGTLVLDSSSIRVPLPHTDVAVRFNGMAKGQNLSVKVRSKDTSMDGYGCRFDGGKGAVPALTIFYPTYAVLKKASGAHDSSNFFEGEFRVVGGKQTLLLDGQIIASAADTRIASGKGINVSSQGGIAHFKRIEVKILTPATGGNPLANNPAAIPSPGTALPPGVATKDPNGTPPGESGAPASTNAAATKDSPFVNSLGMKFVPVPITGGPTDGKRVLFSVWETRVRDYEQFVKETKRDWPIQDSERVPDHPAVRVSWEDAKAFCEWMTLRERATGKIGSDEEYRLPSDHEWSCAVGIGKDEDPAAAPIAKNLKTPGYPWGEGFPPPKGAGNYKGEETRKGNPKAKGAIPGYDDGFVDTAPVGSFAANALGIHDLGGNTWEWCEDLYDPGDPTRRVHRGRAYDHSSDLLSSWRHGYPPNATWWNSGFRCVLASSASANP